MKKIRNRVQLIGNLGMDPELNEFGKEKVKASFSLATSESYTDSKGKLVQEVEWHNVVAWGKLARIVASYLRKGSHIAVEGKLVHRTFEDKTGQKRYVTEIVMGELLMLGAKEAATNA